MPHHPGLSRPILALLESGPGATFIEVGSAEESGIDVFCRVKTAFPTGTHGSRVDGNSLLPWNARLFISSAYIPPSPEWLMSSNMRPYMSGDDALPPVLETFRLMALAILARNGRKNGCKIILMEMN